MELNNDQVTILLQIQKYQLILNQLLDNRMVNHSEVSEEMNQTIYPKNFKKKYYFYKRMFIIYLIISLLSFIFFFFYLKKEHDKELVELKNSLTESHNKALDMIMKDVNKFRMKSYSIF